jgi:tetratricopeptide (TPR) repeat protein
LVNQNIYNYTCIIILCILITSNYEIYRYDKAFEEISAAIEYNKNAIEPLLILSAIYIKTEDYKNALATLLKARNKYKENLEIIYQIGSLYYKIEDQKYIKYFSLLFNKLDKKKSAPQKYYKAFILLLKNQYENCVLIWWLVCVSSLFILNHVCFIKFVHVTNILISFYRLDQLSFYLY